MAHCELCGKETELISVEIEGIEMSTCRNCAQHGQIKEIPQARSEVVQKNFNKPGRPEPHLEVTESIISDYAQKIRKAREKLGLKQEDFAKKINEKESLLHKMETGEFEPSLPLARKLEKLLNIQLIEKVEEKKLNIPKGSAGGLTIGDLIKIK